MRGMTATMALAWALASLGAAGAFAADESKDEKKAAKAEAKREDVDAMAKETLDKVTAESATAKKQYADAVGYAVFDNWHTSFALAGGSGTGVAVDKASGERTYMKMRTVGLKLGLGVQKCQVLFLFQTKERFRQFIEDGWEAEAGAEAAAGTEGVAMEAQWRNGMATYQITEKGLMLSADISGTKYYPAKKLN